MVDPEHATVHYLASDYPLVEGTPLTFGRSTTCDIPVGSGENGPVDGLVSRIAGSFSILGGRVHVRNLSRTNPLYVYPDTGSGYLLSPGSDEVAPGSPTFAVVAVGEVKSYEMKIDRGAQAAHSTPVIPDGATLTAERTAVRFDLRTPAERRILAVFCERLLTLPPPAARPLTYREAAERLGRSESYLKNTIAEVCQRHLTLGLPGMGAPDAKDQLCRQAVWAQVVTVADLPGLVGPSLE